jgi:hypothetical protein
LPELTGWADVLDDLERRIDACRAGDLGEMAGWEPPSGMPALPRELTDRAAALAVAQRDVLTELESERARIAAELSAARGPSRQPDHGMGVYFDATA